MSVINLDVARRRAELERMSDAAGRRARVGSSGQPLDMRHARRFAEIAEARRPRVLEDPFWADRHKSEPTP